ncbi:MAG: SIR2 family protein [Bacillota bacterium]|nr:SIR2 family protein [Bacillota bacterium]
MKKKILDILKQSETLPFLFVGSGLSRRYLGLEDWEGLLKRFAKLSNEEEFAYEIFLQQVEKIGNKEGKFPKIAELIENEFNQTWYKDSKFKSSREKHRDEISNQISPFKLEVADYMSIKSSEINDEYKDELSIFREIGNKGIAGNITTNYDTFLEDTFNNFTTYIGQEELIFSQIQGISEIYKIHGCASKPETMVINEKDYVDFTEKNAYLAAKLLTIFLEHPIIFLGYSISDKNIESILKSIITCLSQEHLKKLKERLIFIEWDEESIEEIATYSKAFEGEKHIDMTRIKLNDFSALYQALVENKGKYNVSMLRRLKEDIYELVLTNKATGNIRVIGLEEDDKLDQVEVVVGVGVVSEFGQRGYLGVSADEIYVDIVLDDRGFEIERIVTDTLPILLKRNSNIYQYINILVNMKAKYLIQSKLVEKKVMMIC